MPTSSAASRRSSSTGSVRVHTENPRPRSVEERLGHRDHVGAGNVVVDAPDAVAERHEVGRPGEQQHAVALDDLVRRLPPRVLARELDEVEMAERGVVESRHERRR